MTTQQCSTAQQHNNNNAPYNNTTTTHRTTTQQQRTAHHPPCSPPFLLTLESLSLAQTVVVGAPPRVAIAGPNRWPKPLAQTVSDLGMRLRGDLPKQRASSLDWCANPPGDRRECGRGANRFGSRHEIACCVRRPPRVTVVVPTPRVIVESVDVHRLVQS